MAQQENRHRLRRRTIAIAIIALIVTTTAIGISLKPWLSAEPVMASPK
jgi:hypothetical protein